MRDLTINSHAAEFVHRFGNVGKSPLDLLNVAPTKSQLEAARQVCYDNVDKAVDTILRVHAGGGEVEGTGIFYAAP